MRRKQQLSTEQYEQRSQEIEGRCVEVLSSLDYNTIHLYLPIARNREPNTFDLIRRLAPDKTVAVSRTDFEMKSMHFFRFTDRLDIKENHLGIPEPVSGTQVEQDEIEVLIMPMVAADRTGNRVGYGGGYYDRLLAEMKNPVKKLG